MPGRRNYTYAKSDSGEDQTMNDRLKILGIMTGTSCDGADLACLQFERQTVNTIWTASFPYPAKLKAKVLAFQKPKTKVSVEELLALNYELGSWYARLVAKTRSSHNTSDERPDAIALHGQTLAHFPHTKTGKQTLQSGDPSVVAFETGLTVLSHFRHGDLAAGGQGAPLLPLFHQWIAPKDKAGVAIHNLGGVSNFSYFESPGISPLAFDTGPANFWIDEAVTRLTRGKKTYDAGGALALKGDPDFKAVEKILKMPYFKKAPPKSTGRDDFPFELLLRATRAKGVDLVATAAWVSLESMAQAYERFVLARNKPLTSIYLCGGGAKNLFLKEGLSTRLQGVHVGTSEELGVDPQFMEASGFAFMGLRSLLGLSVGGIWTGNTSSQFTPPAWITPGTNWSEISSKIPQLKAGFAPGERNQILRTGQSAQL